jgi:hypothetical protein
MVRNRVEETLKKELKKLQKMFDACHELTLKYLPGEIRYSQNGKPLSGEVSGNVILIYEDKEDKALSTLYHEFVEYLITPLIGRYLDVINYQNKIISKFLSDKKEEIVERFAKTLNRAE